MKVQITKEITDTITCQICNKQHPKSLSNCCWINCYDNNHDVTMCGNCGSTNIIDMDMDENDKHDEEAQYWCCQKCADCGLEGCSMCI